MSPYREVRTAERLRHHYEVEMELADRLRASHSFEERARIYATMYDELFRRVPDHPRLTAHRDLRTEQLEVGRLLALLQPWLHVTTEYVEFGAGTCALAFAVAARVRRSRAVEIADQIAADATRPPNFELVIYDGWTLDLPADSVDVVFSEQFVEHLHPDDAAHHFEIVHRILRPGGVYVLRTPERWTGPHDISRSFSVTPRGFHLREWTYRELVAATRRAGFRSHQAYWNARGLCLRWPLAMAVGVETFIGKLPLAARRKVGHKLIPMVTIAVVK